MTERKWYETHDNLVGLAEWLNSECCYFSDAGAVIYFFEKPWKWNREYALWKLWNESKEPLFRETIVEAVFDDKITAEQLLAEQEETSAESN